MILSSVINAQLYANISRAVMLQDVHVHYIFLRGFFLMGGGGCFCFISLILRPIVYCALALNALICTISDHKLRNTCIPLVQLIVENKFESTFKCPG